MPLSEAQAKIIARIEAKILDAINDAKTNGGTFLQQSPTVTVGGQPVAIKIGGAAGALGAVGDALSTVTAVVQAAGSIASLVQNPMALVETAVGSALSGVSSQLTGVTGQLTGGQLSSLSGALSSLNTTLTDFQAHTSNLSGLSSSITDTVGDFNKIKDLGNSLQQLGSASRDEFIQNTASALFSGPKLTNTKDILESTVTGKLGEISRLDANTAAGQTQIATLVTDISNLLNNQNTTISGIVTSDTHNFNESSNTLTASTSVLGLYQDFSDANSVSYTLLNAVGKTSTITAFNSATAEANT